MNKLGQYATIAAVLAGGVLLSVWLQPAHRQAAATTPPALAAAARNGSSPSLTVGAAQQGDHRWEVIVGIKNESEPRGLRLVGLKCTWLLGETPVEVSGSVALDVAYGATVHEKLLGPRSATAVDRVQCRSSYAYPN